MPLFPHPFLGESNFNKPSSWRLAQQSMGHRRLKGMVTIALKPSRFTALQFVAY
jgi:hypothetical protein